MFDFETMEDHFDAEIISPFRRMTAGLKKRTNRSSIWIENQQLRLKIFRTIIMA